MGADGNDPRSFIDGQLLAIAAGLGISLDALRSSSLLSDRDTPDAAEPPLPSGGANPA